MAHTFINLNIHLIFSTKNRDALLTPDLQARLFPYMTSIVRNLGGVSLSLDRPADHVHMLLSMPATLCLSDLVRDIKANSSKWIHEEIPGYGDFGWQTGYGAFSVSMSSVEKVRTYIDNQQEHHRTTTFQEEFIAFLDRHGISYDERFIWE